ncbi:MAG: hypothetical protein AABX33_03700 [Nanoarchaeota archaeon]
MEESRNPTRREFFRQAGGALIALGLAPISLEAAVLSPYQQSPNAIAKEPSESKSNNAISSDINKLIANGDFYLKHRPSEEGSVPYPNIEKEYRLSRFLFNPLNRKNKLDMARRYYEKSFNLSLGQSIEMQVISQDRIVKVLLEITALPKGNIAEKERKLDYASLYHNLIGLRSKTRNPTYEQLINEIAPKVPLSYR